MVPTVDGAARVVLDNHVRAPTARGARTPGGRTVRAGSTYAGAGGPDSQTVAVAMLTRRGVRSASLRPVK